MCHNMCNFFTYCAVSKYFLDYNYTVLLYICFQYIVSAEMEYDLSKVIQGKIEYNIDHAMPFGDMPSSMLMSKFAETDMGDEEGAYDDYVRNEITEWGPDRNKFEHEEPRGGVNKNSGRLQLQYYGHRGSVDTPYRPEIFDAFMGDEDRDPRGINVEPDSKELRKQEEARMRFIRFSADQCDQITGGGRSEGRLMADQQLLFRSSRDRLKIFDRQIDGRREGMRREYKHKSNIPKSILIQSYGDVIRDYGLNPQRRATVICQKILRGSRLYCNETMDGDFAIAQYTQLRRANRANSVQSRVVDQTSQEMASADTTMCYKAAGLLMANIIKSKKLLHDAPHDIEFAQGRTTRTAKTAPFHKDLALIMQSVTTDSEFRKSDRTMVGKTPNLVQAEHGARQSIHNHDIHVYNMEYIAKSARQGGDYRKARNLIITDNTVPNLRDTSTYTFKTARQKTARRKDQSAQDTDRAESTKTISYKTVLKARRHDVGKAVVNVNGKSDLTQARRINHTNYKNSKPGDTVEMSRYGDNAYQDRHTRGLGTKYTMRSVDRDNKLAELSALSS